MFIRFMVSLAMVSAFCSLNSDPELTAGRELSVVKPTAC
jgi:hypothetical protein